MGLCTIEHVCVYVCNRKNGIITSQVNNGKQLGHKKLTWPTDFNASARLNGIPLTISAHTHRHVCTHYRSFSAPLRLS